MAFLSFFSLKYNWFDLTGLFLEPSESMKILVSFCFLFMSFSALSNSPTSGTRTERRSCGMLDHSTDPPTVFDLQKIPEDERLQAYEAYIKAVQKNPGRFTPNPCSDDEEVDESRFDFFHSNSTSSS